ncbi:hypothetical protein DNR41_27485, partial [Escherichia coli]|uniref:hypothetical protein n=1 Tax=Escherichia coli TaxID=562 RepID=UPI000DBBED2E
SLIKTNPPRTIFSGANPKKGFAPPPQTTRARFSPQKGRGVRQDIFFAVIKLLEPPRGVFFFLQKI